MRDATDVQSKSSAAPVAKKSAPISSTPTHAVSKPPNDVIAVDKTFFETPVSRSIAPKPRVEKLLRSIIKASV